MLRLAIFAAFAAIMLSPAAAGEHQKQLLSEVSYDHARELEAELKLSRAINRLPPEQKKRAIRLDLQCEKPPR